MNGKEFIISEECACVSRTLRILLKSPDKYTESHNKMIELPFSSKTISRIIEYLELRLQNNEKNFELTDEESLDLLEISNYLCL